MATNSNQKKAEKPIVGVEFACAKPYAFCQSKKWTIRPDVATKDVLDGSSDIMERHDAAVQKAKHVYVQHRVAEPSVREILELTLEKFDYDKAANDPASPPALLTAMAGEVSHFGYGGAKPGMLRAQMLLGSITPGS